MRNPRNEMIKHFGTLTGSSDAHFAHLLQVVKGLWTDGHLGAFSLQEVASGEMDAIKRSAYGGWSGRGLRYSQHYSA